MTFSPAPSKIEDDQQAIEDAIYALTLASELFSRHKGDETNDGATAIPGESALASLIRDPVNKSCLAAVSTLADHLGSIVSDHSQVGDVFARIRARVLYALDEPAIPTRLQ